MRFHACLLTLAALTAGCTFVIAPPPGELAPGTTPSAGTTPTGAASPTSPTSPTSPGGFLPIASTQVLHHDGFEAGLEKWHVNQGEKLMLKSVIGGASEGQAAVAFADESDAIAPGLEDSANLVFRSKLDLSGTKLPRLRYWVKGGASPEMGSAVQVVWMNQPTYEPGLVELWSQHENVGAAARATGEWQARDVDLSAYKSKPGFLRFKFDAAAVNLAAYGGLRLDDVTIYDAGVGTAAPAAGTGTGTVVADEAVFDSRIVGTWDIFVPTALGDMPGAGAGVVQTPEAARGTQFGRLTIMADATFTWIDAQGLRGQGPLGTHDSVKNVVKHGVNEYYVLPKDDGIMLFITGANVLTLRGTRAF